MCSRYHNKDDSSPTCDLVVNEVGANLGNQGSNAATKRTR